MKSLLAVICLLLAVQTIIAAEPEPRFSADAIRAHVSFLADDLLEGRETGSRGYDIAAHYVAAQFTQYGLKPAGVDGSWFIPVNFQVRTIADGSAVTVIGPKGEQRWDNGSDVIVSASANFKDQDVEAGLVFVGYGIDEKRVGIDDYRGLDVRGKIVVVLGGYPKGMDSEIGAYLGNVKDEVAARHGAIGMIGIDTDQSERVSPWAKRVETLHNKGMTWLGPDGKAESDKPAVWGGVRLDRVAAEALFAGAPATLAQIRSEADKDGGRPKGFALKTRIHIERHSEWSQLSSPEIAGMIEGSDPVLKNEYVVLMGHADHLGIDTRRSGDQIFNGALDNAAGVATLLEVAHAFATSTQKPRRSIIFFASTGEEKGLLGADFFAHHPTVPIKKIVGLVDLDMPILLYDFIDVTAFGAGHSTMGRIVQRAAAKMNVALAPDPLPEEGIFTRSDHYMFVQRGVPAIMLATGFGNGGEQQWREFLDQRYHQPSDDLSQPILWDAGAKFAHLNYLITSEMANADERPLWLQGDFFGDVFAPGQPRAPR
ncbi:MAG TPA: M28 family peptidase [Candidatus Acidoferrum sp.]|nr:M28 family peptidase [Candidatus Acidoferrum sp.]